MTITQAITIIGIVLSAAVALIVAYLHRRQMRQIELFKQDPSVGLVPKPNRLTAFVMSRWDSILGYGGPVLILCSEFLNTAPVTRLTIFNIATSLILLLGNLVLSLIFKVQKRNSERIEAILAIQAKHVGLTDRVVSVLERSA